MAGEGERERVVYGVVVTAPAAGKEQPARRKPVNSRARFFSPTAFSFNTLAPALSRGERERLFQCQILS